MRKTKKRVTAATKLQALVRGKLARRTATAKKQQKQVKGRSAYKSYLSSFTLDNTEKVGGFAGLDLLHSFQPQLEQSLKEHGGLKIHISSIGLYRKSVRKKVMTRRIFPGYSPGPRTASTEAAHGNTSRRFVTLVRTSVTKRGQVEVTSHRPDGDAGAQHR